MIIRIYSSWTMLILFDINPYNRLDSGSCIGRATMQSWNDMNASFQLLLLDLSLNVTNCSVFLFIFRHAPLTRQRNRRETPDCFEVLSESFCEGRYLEMSSEARHFCVAARVIHRNDFCSGAATDACPNTSRHPWSHHNPRAYNLPMGCINPYGACLIRPDWPWITCTVSQQGITCTEAFCRTI